ncbi:MAG: tetraacyldisaccharide 4'-kinase, partial [Phycisphaerae bacterium]
MSSQNLASWHAAAIGNRSPLRFPLWLCSLVYRRAVDYRNRRYDNRSGVTAVSVPVVSIGNITCGGTGKTPLVIDIARRLEACGYQPAILSRGYGARPGEPNDEERLIRRHLPDTPYLASKNRVEAALAAVDSHGADCLILDDGFQHRRLARDLDIVLIDATDPFGGGFLLPRGLLREPVESIRRAHLVILTRTDQVPLERLDAIVETIQSHAPGVEILHSRHQFAGMQSMAGEPMDMPATPKRFLLVAAIGNPEAFEKTAASIGVTVADRLWW